MRENRKVAYRELGKAVVRGALGRYCNLLMAFRKGLAEVDLVEGQNVSIEGTPTPPHIARSFFASDAGHRRQIALVGFLPKEAPSEAAA